MNHQYIKMKYLLYLFLVSVLLNACKTMDVKKTNYIWKSFDERKLEQSVDLSKYADPNKRNGQDESTLIILCSSGGGSRAASFTTGVMLELEKISYSYEGIDGLVKSNLLNQIDYFSTVSGGGWGAASYLAFLYQNKKYGSDYIKSKINNVNGSALSMGDSIYTFRTFNEFENPYLQNRLDYRYFKYQWNYIFASIFARKYSERKADATAINRFNMGYLGRAYREDLEEKLWQDSLPLKWYMPDRFEDNKFETNLVDNISLGDVFVKRGSQANFPMFIANTTNIDNYTLVPFTPDILYNWGVTEYNDYYLGRTSLIDSSFSNDTVLRYKDIPFATAIKASSAIPFLNGSTNFKAQKSIDNGQYFDYYMHLMDGGMVDQQAMHTAKAILNQEKNVVDPQKRIVIIVDNSSSGINDTPNNETEYKGRLYALSRAMAPFATPDAQYPITRERIKLFEKEYGCTVIYLGTELLLDYSLGNAKDQVKDSLQIRKQEVRKYLTNKYKTVKNDSTSFENWSLKDRTMLYEYIRSFVPTWFASKGSVTNGKYLSDETEGSAKIMLLAGRGAVQLKRKDISKLIQKTTVKY